MATKPISTPLPADLPENWTTGQTVAPTGAEVGLSEQHGYNYLMQQVNAAQEALNTINNAFEDLATTEDVGDITPDGIGAIPSSEKAKPTAWLRSAATGRCLWRSWQACCCLFPQRQSTAHQPPTAQAITACMRGSYTRPIRTLIQRKHGRLHTGRQQASWRKSQRWTTTHRARRRARYPRTTHHQQRIRTSARRWQRHSPARPLFRTIKEAREWRNF